MRIHSGDMDYADHPHRRYNPLTGDWVLVSPQRTKRPWQGKTDAASSFGNSEWDADCYLCPGNKRAGGKKNPAYEGTFIFDNDFPALLPDPVENTASDGRFFRAENENGICRVMCYSPRHDLTMALMNTGQIELIIKAWIDEYADLGKNPRINYVQIFENRGSIMGCSNLHPHGQIWSTGHIPQIPDKEDLMQQRYYEEQKSILLADYLDDELNAQKRIVAENNSFAVLVPWWAVWPYETMILPKRRLQSIACLTAGEINDLASILQLLCIKYDNLFSTSFPYSMGIHQAPTNGKANEHWQLHFHFYPPLLRSAAVQKFMVGYELLANPQRDITAELSADILKKLPSRHFSVKVPE